MVKVQMIDKENNMQTVQQEQNANGKLFAIASMIFGVVAIVCMFIFWVISPVFAIAGIAMSHMANVKGYTGSMRKVGFALSLVALGLLLIYIVYFEWIAQIIDIITFDYNNLDIASDAIIFVR